MHPRLGQNIYNLVIICEGSEYPSPTRGGRTNSGPRRPICCWSQNSHQVSLGPTIGPQIHATHWSPIPASACHLLVTTIWKICSFAGAQAFGNLEEKNWRWSTSLEKENSSVDMDLVASLKAVAVLACVRGVVRILTFILSGNP